MLLNVERRIIMSEKVIEYIKSQRECVDEWWFVSYHYQGVWYTLTFDSDFQLVCINREIRQGKNISFGDEVEDTTDIYDEFLHSIG